jgi:hypothetical protein
LFNSPLFPTLLPHPVSYHLHSSVRTSPLPALSSFLTSSVLLKFLFLFLYTLSYPILSSFSLLAVFPLYFLTFHLMHPVPPLLPFLSRTTSLHLILTIQFLLCYPFFPAVLPYLSSYPSSSSFVALSFPPYFLTFNPNHPVPPLLPFLSRHTSLHLILFIQFLLCYLLFPILLLHHFLLSQPIPPLLPSLCHPTFSHFFLQSYPFPPI